MNCERCGRSLSESATDTICPACVAQLGQASWLSEPEEAAAESAIALNPPAITETAGAVIGHYKLLELLGEGGFGIVWAAEQREPVRRRVALKIIKLGMDTRQVVARFEAERHALALMDHPNIARVLDAGTTDAGRPYFVLELVKGIPITQYCEREKLRTSDRLDLFIRVCRAIQHAHQKGIIHRDIKPSNILVTLRDGVPVPKVIDFGIAKATQAEPTEKTIYTQYGQFIGTPAYMSPEQIQFSPAGAGDIDTRSDIYSLGVLLYELLTGTTPFDTKELLQSGLDEMRRIIREREPVRPSTRLVQNRAPARSKSGIRNQKSEIESDLDWIVMKCLEKDRTRRYDTANGLARDIERHLSHEPVAARPPSTVYRLQKAWHRNRLVYVSGLAVTAALLFGFLISLRQASLAVRAQRAAEAQELETRRTEYVANMLLAQSYWQNSNIDRLRQILDETADYPQRGFEWYYWQRLCQLDLNTLNGHLGRVQAVAFSPDSSQVATGSHDGTIRIWDARTGRELRLLEGHGDAVSSVAFSHDGERIATASWDGTVIVWESDSGQVQATVPYSARILSVAFSPDGQQIVIGSEDNTASLWELSTRQWVRSFEGHAGPVTSTAFSSDGQWLLTGSVDGTARVWETRTGNQSLKLEGHTQWISSVALSPDDQRVVTASGDMTAKVWEAGTGAELFTLAGHTGAIESTAFSTDGQQIVTGSGDGTAKVWEADTGRELLTLRGHGDEVSSAAFSPNGKWVVTGSWDRTAKVWEADRTREELTLRGHTDAVRAVAFAPDGQRIATGSFDRTAKVWDGRTGSELAHLEGHDGFVNSCAFAPPDGERIATASSDRTAKLWDARTGSCVLTLQGHTDEVRSVGFSPEGTRIVTTSWDGTAKVWDANTGHELMTLDGHTAEVNSAAFSPNGGLLATASWDTTVKLWQPDIGRELLTFMGHNDRISTVVFSPNGRHLLSGGADRMAKLWEADTGREVLTLAGHLEVVIALAFSPDGQRMLTGSFDGTGRLWDRSTGRELLTLRMRMEPGLLSPPSVIERLVPSRRGNTASVWAVAFSPDGHRIAIGRGDGTIKVFEGASEPQVTARNR
jgi:eukaryotic-like serine/threonine-protein kinase